MLTCSYVLELNPVRLQNAAQRSEPERLCVINESGRSAHLTGRNRCRRARTSASVTTCKMGRSNTLICYTQLTSLSSCVLLVDRVHNIRSANQNTMVHYLAHSIFSNKNQIQIVYQVHYLALSKFRCFKEYVNNLPFTLTKVLKQ